MKILIGGGSGFLGKHLTQLLKQKGHDVQWISRKHGVNRITWKDVERNGFPQNTGAVVNLAGELLLNPLKRWSEEVANEIRSSRINTTNTIVSAIAGSANPPPVFVSSSAVGYYAPSATNKYTEDSPGGADHDFATRLCEDCENAAKLADGCPTKHVIVRIGLVLGRDGGLMQHMYWPFFFGVGGRIGSGRQWFPWVHVQDAAGIIAHAIEEPKVTGVLNAVAPQSATNSDFTQALGKAMGRPTIFPVPGFAVRIMFGSQRAGIICSGQRVIPKRTIESGYKFYYPDLQSACENIT